jgi:hypothetical protein
MNRDQIKVLFYYEIQKDGSLGRENEIFRNTEKKKRNLKKTKSKIKRTNGSKKVRRVILQNYR